MEEILPGFLAFFKAQFARPSGTLRARVSDTLRAMAEKRPKKLPSPLKLAVARRLRAVQDELGVTQEEVAATVGVSRSAWSNWVSLSSPEMPAEEAMIALCKATSEWRLTLDWIYRGVTDRLDTRQAIRLTARVIGVDPETATGRVLELAETT